MTYSKQDTYSLGTFLFYPLIIALHLFGTTYYSP